MSKVFTSRRRIGGLNNKAMSVEMWKVKIVTKTIVRPRESARARILVPLPSTGPEFSSPFFECL